MNKLPVMVLLPLILAASISIGSVAAASGSVLSVNVTISNSTALSGNLNTTGWLVIAPGASLNTNGYLVSAKGILVAGTLSTTGPNSITNTSYLILNQSTSQLDLYQNTLNVSDIVNYGTITHTNYFEVFFTGYNNANGVSFNSSYGGSGGGIITYFQYFNGNRPIYNDGGNTLAPGGVGGLNGSAYPAGSEPSESLSNYTYNQSLLEGATGAYFAYPSDIYSYAGYGFVLSAPNISNYGLIENNVPNSFQDGAGGIAVGGGGAGVVELLYYNSLVQGKVIARGGNGSADSAVAAVGGNASVFAFKTKSILPPVKVTKLPPNQNPLIIIGNSLSKVYYITIPTMVVVLGNSNNLGLIVETGGSIQFGLAGNSNKLDIANSPNSSVSVLGNSNSFTITGSSLPFFTLLGNSNTFDINGSSLSNVDVVGNSNVFSTANSQESLLTIDGNSNVFPVANSVLPILTITGDSNSVSITSSSVSLLTIDGNSNSLPVKNSIISSLVISGNSNNVALTNSTIKTAKVKGNSNKY